MSKHPFSPKGSLKYWLVWLETELTMAAKSLDLDTQPQALPLKMKILGEGAKEKKGKKVWSFTKPPLTPPQDFF